MHYHVPKPFYRKSRDTWYVEVDGKTLTGEVLERDGAAGETVRSGFNFDGVGLAIALSSRQGLLQLGAGVYAKSCGVQFARDRQKSEQENAISKYDHGAPYISR